MNISKYTIISNSCVGARIYQHLKRQFDNPFIWCMVLLDDILTVLDNWANINFKNYKLIEANDVNPYGINVDEKFTIYYPHYIKDENYKEPFRSLKGENGLDIKYCDIETYIKEHYERRVLRMTESKKPFFVFAQSLTTRLVSFDNLLEVQKCAIKNQVESVIITNYRELKKYETEKNLVVIYEKDILKTPTAIIAKDLMKKLSIKYG